MKTLDIRSIPAGQLNPASYNPRKDLQPGDAEYEKLLRSVEEFGFVEPVVWNSRTGNIVGGHQRFKVLVQLGYTEIDCVVVDLDEAREKALNVALNKISGEWDLPKLADVMRSIEDSGLSFEITGFEQPDLDKLYQKMQRERGVIVEDEFDAEAEAASISEPITQLGDVWEIGRHRLMCGDSTDAEQVARLMGGVKARCVFTDPPWNVNYGGSEHPHWKRRHILNDKMSGDEFYQFLLSVFKAMASVTEPGAAAYVVMSAQEWGSLMGVMREAGYHWSSTIIWAKDSFVLSRKDYHTQYEPIWYGWLEGAARLCRLEDKQQSDLWQISRPKRSDDHPTMKPIELVARALSNSSRTGDAVLDLFGGSGTTMMAAEQTGRVAYLMELEPRYCDVMARRYAKMVNSEKDIFILRNGERIAYSDV